MKKFSISKKGVVFELVGDTKCSITTVLGLNDFFSCCVSDAIDACRVLFLKGAETNLVLDQELDTLNGGSSGLGDSGGDTTHCENS